MASKSLSRASHSPPTSRTTKPRVLCVLPPSALAHLGNNQVTSHDNHIQHQSGLHNGDDAVTVARSERVRTCLSTYQYAAAQQHRSRTVFGVVGWLQLLVLLISEPETVLTEPESDIQIHKLQLESLMDEEELFVQLNKDALSTFDSRDAY